MNISEKPDCNFTLPQDSCKNLHFIKNKEGQRAAKELQDSELEDMKEKKEIGVIIIGHIGHTQAQIIEILNRHNVQTLQGEIIMIENSNNNRHLLIKDIEEKMQETDSEKPFIFTAPPKNDIPIFFLEEKKQTHKNFNKHYIPKTQKSKAGNNRKPPHSKCTGQARKK
ncbi:MAG: hypothetical protein WC606_01615 [Candidatus Absconditabacterales bacterium]|jgi:hypothetical protein